NNGWQLLRSDYRPARSQRLRLRKQANGNAKLSRFGGGIGVSSYSCPQVVRANPDVSRISLRKEGEVAWLESPNGLGATAEFQLRGEVSRTKFPAILCRRSTSLGKRTDEQTAVRCLSADAGADQQRPLD